MSRNRKNPDLKLRTKACNCKARQKSGSVKVFDAENQFVINRGAGTTTSVPFRDDNMIGYRASKNKQNLPLFLKRIRRLNTTYIAKIATH
jgi:hypothetical protein